MVWKTMFNKLMEWVIVDGLVEKEGSCGDDDDDDEDDDDDDGGGGTVVICSLSYKPWALLL